MVALEKAYPVKGLERAREHETLPGDPPRRKFSSDLPEVKTKADKLVKDLVRDLMTADEFQKELSELEETDRVITHAYGEILTEHQQTNSVLPLVKPD